MDELLNQLLGANEPGAIVVYILIGMAITFVISHWGKVIAILTISIIIGKTGKNYWKQSRIAKRESISLNRIEFMTESSHLRSKRHCRKVSVKSQML